jgi:chitinase
VVIRPDTSAEAAETFRVTLTGVNGGGYSLGQAIAAGTILDNDPGVPDTATVGDVSIWEGNRVRVEPVYNAVKIPVTLPLPASSSGTVTATVVPGSAQAGTDYVAPTKPTVVTFGAGQFQKDLTVKVLADISSEADETFTVVLSAPTGGISLGSHTVGTITILNDD